MNRCSSRLMPMPRSQKRAAAIQSAQKMKLPQNELLAERAHRTPGTQSEVVVAAPAVIGNAQIIYGNRNWSTSVSGVVPDHLVARDWRPRLGAAVPLTDGDGASKVALLGATAAEKLFEDEDPVGKLMRIGTVPFLVVGVLEAKGQSAAGRDQDDFVMIPLTTAKMRVLGGKHEVSRAAVDYIYVK